MIEMDPPRDVIDVTVIYMNFMINNNSSDGKNPGDRIPTMAQIPMSRYSCKMSKGYPSQKRVGFASLF